MNEDEILKFNKKVNEEVSLLQKDIDFLEKKKKGLNDSIMVPCEYCPLDGQFRCEACEDANFAGFRDRDWF